MTHEELLAVLEIRLPESDAGDDITIRDYLHRLLTAVWDKGESFNSKRPFGNSGWRYDLYAPLITAGILSGTFDEDEGWEVADDKESEAFVREMICAVFYGGKIEGAA